MNLNNLNLVELGVKQAVVINGGHVPANDWGNFKEGVRRIGSGIGSGMAIIAHEVSDFFRGFYDGL